MEHSPHRRNTQRLDARWRLLVGVLTMLGVVVALLLLPSAGRVPSNPSPPTRLGVVTDLRGEPAANTAQTAKIKIPRSFRTPQHTYRVKIRVAKPAACSVKHRRVSRVIRLSCTVIPADGNVLVVVSDKTAAQRVRYVVRFPPTPDSPTTPTTPSGPGYTFLMTQSDQTTPVRWDPCQGPVIITVSGQAATAAQHDVIVAATDKIRSLTGLDVRVQGSTSFIPTPDNPDDGDPNTDIVAWAGSRTTIGLLKDNPQMLGYGGFAATTTDGSPWVATHGFVVIPMDTAAEMSASRLTRLYMHEFGHAFGLGHIDDTAQVMYPMLIGDVAAWGTGDSAGLAAVGASRGCVVSP